MATIGRLCYELLLMLVVVQVCQTAPATNAHRRRRRFIAPIRDGFCPAPQTMLNAGCELAALQPRCKNDRECNWGEKCCKHVRCIGVYVCTEALTAYDLGFPFFRPGRCYDIQELTEKLKGKCTEENSCDHDQDCSSPEHKCCFVDLSSGFRRQCFQSIPSTDCNVKGLTYPVGQVVISDNECITCTCAISTKGPVIECVEDHCANGVPIDDAYMHLSFGPDKFFNRISNQEGMVVAGGVAGMNIGIQNEHQDQ